MERTDNIIRVELRQRWGDPEMAAVKVMKRHLKWLGHLTRMPDHHIPKICLFSWLPQPHPQGGPRLRWRDKVIGVSKDRWYDEASVSSLRWKTAYRKGLESLSIASYHQEAQEHSSNQIKCDKYKRSFRRKSDKKHHKCISERQKPVSEQHGAVQCTMGLGVMEALSTIVDLTKQVKFNLWGGGGRGSCGCITAAKPKEGGVYVCV